jgi:glycosyltransferase involved in cell wall biosynthesis
MIGVVIPAHDEALMLPRALAAVQFAARHPALRGEPVLTVVALDGCTDDSEGAARRGGALCVHTPGGNVGAARAAGAALALAHGARWLAFTDADSEAADDWLAAQLALDCDAVCGTIEVRDWGSYGDAMRAQHLASYTDADGHRHIHGANLGVSASAYRRAGGFAPLASSEDVALVHALQACGARIAWSARPRMATSARRDHRAPGGFGALLVEVERRLSAGTGDAL